MVRLPWKAKLSRAAGLLLSMVFTFKKRLCLDSFRIARVHKKVFKENACKHSLTGCAIQWSRCGAWARSFGKDESILHRQGQYHLERCCQPPRDEHMLPFARNDRTRGWTLKPLQRGLWYVETSCGGQTKPGVYAVPQSRCDAYKTTP